MEFSSLIFLCVFLPVVFVLYYILPWVKVQNGLLIIASLLFYAYGEPVFVLLMLGSSLLNYIMALAVDSSGKKLKKIILAVDIVINIGVLVFFKYTAMFVSNLNNITKLGLKVPDIALPLGISFFTFQAMSYVIDVYRGISKAQKNYFKVLLYISFFPQLIAGPIVKYHEIEDFLTERNSDLQQIAAGFRRFIYGLSKKIFIANVMGAAVDAVYELNSVNIALAWIAAIGYMLQIYFDFSGYSDMAIGLGTMFGFKFPENFNYPYSAVSIRDFWRRWHITLSGWFKDYLYIPLGGNRKGKLRTGFNRLFVFFCTGLWHGANWTFVVWGLYHGFFSVLENHIHIKKENKIIRFAGHIYTLLVVCIGFVIFRADTIGQAFDMIKAMFTGFDMSKDMTANVLIVLSIQFIVMAVIGIIASWPVIPGIKKLVAEHKKASNVLEALTYILALILLMLCMISLAGNGYNPFIYFRF